MIDVMVIGTFF